MTVYLVTAGDYDDYHIEAVFSTHEKAVEYMGGFPEEFNGVETFEMDSEPVRHFVKAYYHVLTGDGTDVRNYDCVIEKDSSSRGDSDFVKPMWQESWSTASVFFGMSPISAEHAKKLAVEERQRHLRETA